MGGQDPHPQVRESGGQQIPPGGEGGAELREVLIGQGQTFGNRPLERSARDVGQVLPDNLDGIDESAWTGRPANLPAREREGLATRPNSDGPLPHSGEGRDRNVFVVVEPQVLVCLIGDHEEVVLAGDPSHGLEFGPGENDARRIVRGVQQQQSSAGSDCRGEGRRIGAQVRPRKRHGDPSGPGEGDVCRVEVEVRVEHDDLITGFGQRQHRSSDGSRRAGRHHNIGLPVEFQAIAAFLVRCDGTTQFGQPVCRRVLVAAAVSDGLDRRLFDHLGAIVIGEPLS